MYRLSACKPKSLRVGPPRAPRSGPPGPSRLSGQQQALLGHAWAGSEIRSSPPRGHVRRRLDLQAWPRLVQGPAGLSTFDTAGAAQLSIVGWAAMCSDRTRSGSCAARANGRVLA
eukprot:CAMPEP_0179369498 /NCGR_PEP_ID=MMETSP0797-20121207/84647_1 /TAXON_ID=47934 /ORGANISM="Dinophysis acuminata, Strain DAEP01" /LENGTH=114 /DNA_ID=CAMNT_0021085133 /DNA_START=97 /DNA_END=442 /DNA_ORIENTATION=-